ncbi:hypothetical protein HOY80DRAFT_251105 [Tuber brumale]|nr:hypothetical protein HOY80DRAFT_251105 [Tuber brumale]
MFFVLSFRLSKLSIINPSVLLASSFCINQNDLGGDICFFEFLRLVFFFPILLPPLIVLLNYLTTYIVHQKIPRTIHPLFKKKFGQKRWRQYLLFCVIPFSFSFKLLFLKEITGWLMFAFMQLLFAFVLIVLLRLFRECFSFFLFPIFFCVKWVGKMNFFIYILFYKKPKNWFKLNKGILFSICALGRICLFVFSFFYLERQSFLVFQRTKIGKVYLAQNFYKEREQSEIVNGGFLFTYFVGI